MWLTMAMACGEDTPSVKSVESVDKNVETPIATKNEDSKTDATIPVEIQGVLFFAKEADCNTDCVVKVSRTVEEWTPQVALTALYEGPLESEQGLRMLKCSSTGAKLQAIDSGVAKVQLEGGCGGCGTLSIYDLLVPTLKAFSEIDVVQLYDANGKSQVDDPKTDSRPGCLEP